MEEKEIRNHTVYSKKGFDILNRVSVRTRFIACLIIDLILFILDIIMFINKDMTMAIFILILVILYPFFILLLMKMQINRTYKLTLSTYQNLTYDYVFYADRFNVSSQSSAISSNNDISYNAIYRFVETKDFILAFIDKSQAFLIDKDGFDENGLIEFIKLISNNKSIKYKAFLKMK
jgi:hypothetical protein